MQITLENGKQVTIPDEIIRKNMENLELSENDAIELYLSDNDNKLFKLTIGEKNFKIDIVEQRPPKKTEN